MRRLILFSGGVESTAMLFVRHPDDLLVTIEDTSPQERPTYNKLAVLNIAKSINATVQFCTVQVPIAKNNNWVYQFRTFFPVAMVWAAKDPSLSEMWIGGHCNEMDSLDNPQKKYAELVAAWNILFPQIKIVYPLKAYTKIQQWNLIPDAVKPLVRTCLNNVTHHTDANCGTCRKCQELKTLKGSCLNPFN